MGGKASRARRKIKRDAEKKKRKALMQAQYDKWRDSKNNSKRKNKNNKKSTGLIDPRKSPRNKIPFPYHNFLDKDGNLKPGSPHRAYLAWRDR